MVKFEVSESTQWIDGKLDAVIGMFDRTNRESMVYISNIVKNIPRNIPMVIVGNKCDMPSQQCFTIPITEYSTLLRQMFDFTRSMYYDLSAKSNNFEEPFLVLTRKLLKDDTIQFHAPTNN